MHRMLPVLPAYAGVPPTSPSPCASSRWLVALHRPPQPTSLPALPTRGLAGGRHRAGAVELLDLMVPGSLDAEPVLAASRARLRRGPGHGAGPRSTAAAPSDGPRKPRWRRSGHTRLEDKRCSALQMFTAAPAVGGPLMMLVVSERTAGRRVTRAVGCCLMTLTWTVCSRGRCHRGALDRSWVCRSLRIPASAVCCSGERW